MSTYSDFGALVARLRIEAGITQQADLAKMIGTTQQTVSRWELGVSRPRPRQMPDLANALDCDLQLLLHAAGHVPESTSATFAKPFPLAALSAETFECFCHDVLSVLYPKSEVHRVGGAGHTQDGADIEVRLANGDIYSF